MDIEVDYQVLHDAGEHCARVATQVRSCLAGLSVVQQVRAAVPGGVSGFAADELAKAWRMESQAICAELDAYAEKLITSARCYRETEEQAVGLIRDMGLA